jgi:hypothetical protein
MPEAKNSKNHNSTTQRSESHTRNLVIKSPGTRVGTLNDLRASSADGSSERSQHGKRLRDGQ